ncbi:serine protease gd-like isoform X3 [Temnothorax curvispinosus]|uniref:Serine protease gd-like isoform X3 n=1 Tax=Temnothorax curvispinosus TaxID=300111 RepID=A0A6J1PP30_9HYME|nr:serine protease gd-like isoform X3 [Temnothorax curvispinosus]
MVKIFILIALLLLWTMVHGETPCPEYFTYIVDSKTHDIFGQFKISPQPESTEFRLKVLLNASSLPTELANGIDLELAQSVSKSVQAVQQGRPLLYHIYFPRVENMPLLLMSNYQISISGIWFNNLQYCQGFEGSNRNVRFIELGHIVHQPHTQNNLHRKYTRYRAVNPSTDLLNHSKHSKPTIATTSDEIAKNISYPVLSNSSQEHNTNSNNNNNDECGITSYYNESTNSLISNGEETLPGQWPWVAGLFIDRNVYAFRCIGSILTDAHILTAALCLKLTNTNNDTIDHNILEVVLGQFEIHLPNHSMTTVKRYIVGWSLDDWTLTKLRTLRLPIVSQETCLRNDQNFIAYTSERTFCAGLLSEIGPCFGDTGSGLVVFDNSTGRYHLRGVLSYFVRGNTSSSCDVRKYVVYVDVAKYLSWIQQQISIT